MDSKMAVTFRDGGFYTATGIVALFNALMHDDALGGFQINITTVSTRANQKWLDYFAALGIPPRYIHFTTPT